MNQFEILKHTIDEVMNKECSELSLLDEMKVKLKNNKFIFSSLLSQEDIDEVTRAIYRSSEDLDNILKEIYCRKVQESAHSKSDRVIEMAVAMSLIVKHEIIFLPVEKKDEWPRWIGESVYLMVRGAEDYLYVPNDDSRRLDLTKNGYVIGEWVLIDTLSSLKEVFKESFVDDVLSNIDEILDKYNPFEFVGLLEFLFERGLDGSRVWKDKYDHLTGAVIETREAPRTDRESKKSDKVFKELIYKAIDSAMKDPTSSARMVSASCELGSHMAFSVQNPFKGNMYYDLAVSGYGFERTNKMIISVLKYRLEKANKDISKGN